jgi:hypothetical protein
MSPGFIRSFCGPLSQGETVQEVDHLRSPSSIRKTGGYGGKVPAFIRRYNDNWDRVDAGYFSGIGELTVRLWGRLEMVGHVMADRAPDGKEIRPDNSVGRLFSDWLKEKHPAKCGSISYYRHKTAEWEGDAGRVFFFAKRKRPQRGRQIPLRPFCYRSRLFQLILVMI